MTTDTARKLRRTILRVTELERRDTPAWWTVSAPIPAGGMNGSTDASHAGDLTLRADLPATNGTVRVAAASATDAVAKALSGTVTVTLSGQATGYAFGVESVGTAAASHKAFLAVPRGAAVDVRLEDLAGSPSSDWDYNDRSWEVRVAAAPTPLAKGATAASASSGGAGSSGGTGGGGGAGDHNAGSGTQLDPWVWDDLNTGETASVWLDVAPEGADHLRWTYTLTNNSLSYQMADLTPGVNRFFMRDAVTTEVDDLTASIGWVPAVGSDYISWQTPSPLAGPYLTIGQTAVFTFRTPPQPKVPGFGEVGLAGYPEIDPETGQPRLGPLPGMRPMGKVDVPGTPLLAKLQTVTFSDATNTYFKVANDPGDAVYSGGPQWSDSNMDGAITVVGEHQVPVGYIRSTTAAGGTPAADSKIKISATFQRTQGTPTLGVWIRGDGPGGFKVPWTKATVAGDTITLEPIVMEGKFSDKVDHYQSFDIKWQYSAFAGLPARVAGTSKNEMFVTLAKPDVDVPMYVTPLWLFCKSAKGSSTVDDSIVKTFSGFEGTVVKTHPDLDPVYNDPSVDMFYYKDWMTSSATFESMMTGVYRYYPNSNNIITENVGGVVRRKLFNRYDGTCQAWVQMFQFALYEGGIVNLAPTEYMVSRRIGVVAGLLMVNNWKFVGPGTANEGIYTHNAMLLNPTGTYNGTPPPGSYMSIDGNGKWSYYWGAGTEVEDLDGLRGQNTTNPRSTFANHFFVRIGDTVYDPSYGKQYSAPANATTTAWDAACIVWEAASLAGFGTNVSYFGVDGKSYQKLVFGKDVPGVLDSHIAPR